MLSSFEESLTQGDPRMCEGQDSAQVQQPQQLHMQQQQQLQQIQTYGQQQLSSSPLSHMRQLFMPQHQQQPQQPQQPQQQCQQPQSLLHQQPTHQQSTHLQPSHQQSQTLQHHQLSALPEPQHHIHSIQQQLQATGTKQSSSALGLLEILGKASQVAGPSEKGSIQLAGVGGGCTQSLNGGIWSPAIAVGQAGSVGAGATNSLGNASGGASKIGAENETTAAARMENQPLVGESAFFDGCFYLGFWSHPLPIVSIPNVVNPSIISSQDEFIQTGSTVLSPDAARRALARFKPPEACRYGERCRFKHSCSRHHGSLPEHQVNCACEDYACLLGHPLRAGRDRNAPPPPPPTGQASSLQRTAAFQASRDGVPAGRKPPASYICAKCNTPGDAHDGHYLNECPENICYKCGFKGHIATHCTNPRRMNSLEAPAIASVAAVVGIGNREDERLFWGEEERRGVKRAAPGNAPGTAAALRGSFAGGPGFAGANFMRGGGQASSCFSGGPGFNVGPGLSGPGAPQRTPLQRERGHGWYGEI